MLFNKGKYDDVQFDFLLTILVYTCFKTNDVAARDIECRIYNDIKTGNS